MSKDVTETVEEQSQQITGKSRHVNNKIPDYESFFKGEDLVGNNEGKGFVGRLLNKDKKPIIWASFLFLFQNAPVWVMPLIISDAIDLLATRPENFIFRIIIDAIISVLLILLNIPVTVWRNGILNKTIRSRSAEVKRAVVRKLQKLSITYHREIEEGRIQSKILRDIEGIEVYYRTFLFNFIPYIISAIISSTIAIVKSPVVALFFMVIIPANLLLSYAFRKKLKKDSFVLRKENEQLSAKLTTTLQMMQLTKSHGLNKLEEQEVGKRLEAVKHSGLVLDKTNAWFGSASWVCSQIFSVGCLFFCVFICINGVISSGEVVLFQSLFNSISGLILTLIAIYPSLVSGRDSVRSIAEIMRADDVEVDKNRIVVKNVEGSFIFENVCYHYPNSDKLVVNNFNLSVRQGERIAIVGSSGSGKSTVMNLIIGLLSPTSGEIYIDGVPMSEMSLQSYRQFLSVVPQNSILFSGTIRDNITYGLKNYDEQEFQKAVKDANITEFLDLLPNGIDSQVGEHGDKLSGGQKQRISIARALIRNPKILILDEATSALDNVSEYHVQKAIDKLVHQRTTFIVAHRLSTIRNADRIIVMEEGKMVEVGTYEELMALNGRFCELERMSRIREEEAKIGLEAL
ncbi:MAG: ABC transporter ATP-binding protein [Clostridiales bacterium]|nr:ABC transporter ATP-binding protein [Clostridiales bacterium]